MSDFLVALTKQYKGADLLGLIQKPYGENPLNGMFFEYPWGSIAVLEERLAGNKNIFTNGDTSFAWVGDLVTDLQDGFIKRFIDRLTELRRCSEENGVCLQSDELFDQLNGAFAMIAANPKGFCIVTDLMSFIPVYVGTNDVNIPVAFGTHPDIVASISSDSLKLDAVSAGEFLNSGCCTFPNTMHTNAKEIAAGRVHIAKKNKSEKLILNDFAYWSPPKEIRSGYDELELTAELRDIMRSAVERRCNAKEVAVLLSGGLDSRVIMAAVPPSIDCIGFTFSDEFNRETKVSSKVAKCYDRQWIPLIRDPEFLSKNIVNIVKFIGCQFQWVNAHTAGFADTINKYGPRCLLSGTLFDSFLKAHYATDMVAIQQLRGLKSPKHIRMKINYADNMADFWEEHLKTDIVKNVYWRKASRYQNNIIDGRGSIEWLNLYPFSQYYEGSYWAADRRVLPLSLIATDRRILDFAFKCPVELKLNAKILIAAALDIYGKGAKIVNTNDGCKPCSGRYGHFLQRVVRKAQDILIAYREKYSGRSRVQDSWHDYQRYWNNSAEFEVLKKQYCNCLDYFNGLLFENSGKELLFDDNVGWLYGFRLLQLAIWRSIMEKYHVA